MTTAEEISNALRLEGDQHLQAIRKIAGQIDELYRQFGDDQHWLEYPLRYRPVRITGEFGVPYVIGGVSWTHEGIDIGVPIGEPVFACAGGTVVIAEQRKGYGLCVRVEHTWQGERWWTWYAHLSQILMHVGDPVDVATILGRSGNTGNTTGPHLHLTVQREDDTTLLPGCSRILQGCVNPFLFVHFPVGSFSR